jgi:alkanesulfonate monooxygenase SsuD/methylene tetrahydromethanopterin reductase-like flavin-dependent oxidoreductase (luciferase family)
MNGTSPAVGVQFRCQVAPEEIPAFARRTEEFGYSELWLVEDCFFAGAVGPAAAALAATESIKVGLGVLPAVLRNPALTAMELTALVRMFPGRVLPGFGHGIASWMRQVGAFPESQLAALGETVTAVRALLRGEEVTTAGRHVRLDRVRLEFPPAVVPPVALGVRGEKSLRLAGELADGTVLADLASPESVARAKRYIDEGRAAAGRADEHRITLYAPAGDEARVRADVAYDLRRFGPSERLPGDLREEVAELVRVTPDDAALAAALPGAYLAQMALVTDGDPERTADALRALRDAGADAVVLVPPIDLDAADDVLTHVADHVLPLLVS